MADCNPAHAGGHGHGARRDGHSRRDLEPQGCAVPLRTQIGRVAFTIPLRTLTGLRWVTWVAAGNNIAASLLGVDWVPTASWWAIAAGWLVLVTPLGRMAVTVLGGQAPAARHRPGEYPRGGLVHLRLWAAERLADEMGAANIAGAPWMRVYAAPSGPRSAGMSTCMPCRP